MAEPEHLKLQESYPYIFEGHAPGRTRMRPNKGELSFPEKHPAEPLKDPLTREFTHHGGEASARTELY